jgi:hypothetical protein
MLRSLVQHRCAFLFQNEIMKTTKQILVFLLAVFMLAPVYAGPGSCNAKEVRIRSFCVVGTGGDGPTSDHEITWFLHETADRYYPRPGSGNDCPQGYDCGEACCDVPEGSCQSLPNSIYKQVDSAESLIVTVQEHDGTGSSDDWTKVNLLPDEWALNTCEKYELRMAAEWGAQRKELICLNTEISAGPLCGFEIDSCVEKVVPTDAYEWFLDVRPYTGESGRRLLGHEDDFEPYIDGCTDQTYDMSLHVEDGGHLFALMSPVSDEALAKNCPFLATHAQLDGNASNPNSYKELLAWDSRDEFETKFDPQKSIKMGEFSLLQLAAGYKQAVVPSDSVYDVLSRNCASFLLEFTEFLGITIDSRIKSFVAQQILNSGDKRMANMVRESLKKSSDRHLRMSDKDAIELLIEKTNGGDIENI